MQSYVIRTAPNEIRPYLVLLGGAPHKLGVSIADYVASLEPAGDYQRHAPRIIESMHPETWLAEHPNHDQGNVAVVLAVGPVSEADKSVLERLCAMIGDRCVVVIDEATEINANWKSTIRLPPQSSRENCCMESVQVLLSILLLPAADRGRIMDLTPDLLALLKGHESRLTYAHSNGLDDIQEVVDKALQQLVERADPATFDSLIVTAFRGPNVPLHEMRAAMASCGKSLPNAISVFFLPGHEDGGRFSIGLIAGIDGGHNSQPQLMKALNE